jgi:GT2 family glycosyltransferase
MNIDPKVVVGIPTAGRREQLARTLAELAKQRRAPDRVLICPAGEHDYDEAGGRVLPCPVHVLRGPRGLTPQRNAIIEAAPDADILVFFDDDFYPLPDYLEQVVALFVAQPDIVVATNQPLLDGAVGPGLSHDEAQLALDRLSGPPAVPMRIVPTYGGYGCNMALRMDPVVRHAVRFDEKLPLYGWLEDIDFSRRLAAHGRIVKCSSLRGVHLGTKRGRTSGLKLGYSQVANPVYMLRKGSMSFEYAFKQLGRNVAKNVARALWPEPWIDRRGRLKGNVLAVLDLLRGRITPERIQTLK